MTTGPLALAVIVALATAIPHGVLRAWIVRVFVPGPGCSHGSHGGGGLCPLAPPGRRARRRIDATIGGLYVALVVGIYLSHRPERPWPWLSFVAYSWLGMLILLTVMAVLLGGSLGALRIAPVSPERRRFFAKAGTVLAGGALLPLSAAAMASALGAVKVERVSLRFPTLRAPTRLVQLSDVHLGPTLGREWLLGIVARVNALRPDVVVITGDLVDGMAHDLEAELEPLRLLEAPEGVFFVTGNHEYFYDADALVAHLHTLGVRTLRNESVELRGLRLAGVDDLSAGADFTAALGGAPSNAPVVLMAHDPACMQGAGPKGADLVLSGHTHGGQIAPLDWLVRYSQPFVAGLHRCDDTWLYVSRGTGFWGPPMRLRAAPEITAFELTA